MKEAPSTLARSSRNGAEGVSFGRWLLMVAQPGIGIKRWLALGMLGVAFSVMGVALLLSIPIWRLALDFARTATVSNLLGGLTRGLPLIAVGASVVLGSAFMLYQRVAFGARYHHSGKVIQNLTLHRFRSGGPKVVAIGGGTGLSSLLRGIKDYTHNTTAIVTVADDGGSSGRLREELGISPPGDARQCLIALSESEPLMEEVLSYRFSSGGGLEGHSLGNLLLAALVSTRGSLHDALQAAGSLLAVRGRVVPSSLSSDLQLMARTATGRLLSGESAIGHASEPIADIWLEPENAQANEAALEAIAAADIIVIGPGSLYTSILPNFLVPGIAEAVRRSRAPRVLVCNMATQHGETDGLTAEDHWRIFERHACVPVTHFLVNDNPIRVDPKYRQDPVTLIGGIPGFKGTIVRRDLVDRTLPTRHDPAKLARAIIDLARSHSRGVPAMNNGRW